MENVTYPKLNRCYKHYKGGTYKVLFLSKHMTTNEVLVNCQSQEFGSYHSRPLNEWFDAVNSTKSISRMTLIDEA